MNQHDRAGMAEIRKRNAKMKRLRKLGVGFAEIGRKFGLSRQRVHQLIGAKE